MWDLPGPGLEPVFPALAGGFLTTVPPGKPKRSCFIKVYTAEVKSELSLAVNDLNIYAVLVKVFNILNAN